MISKEITMRTTSANSTNTGGVMTPKTVRVACLIGLLCIILAVYGFGQAKTQGADSHVAAAKAAAGKDHTALFQRLCTATAPAAEAAPAPAQRGARGAQQGPPPRSEWHAEPAKVF